MIQRIAFYLFFCMVVISSAQDVGENTEEAETKPVLRQAHIEVGLIVDTTIQNTYGENYIQYLNALFEQVNSFFNDPSLSRSDAEIKVYIKHIYLLDRGMSKLFNNDRNIDTTLTQVSDVRQHLEFHDGVHTAATFYFTRTRFNESVGQSYYKSMCHSTKSVAVVTDIGDQTILTLVQELGHLLGMQHKGPYEGMNECILNYHHIMSETATCLHTDCRWSSCNARILRHTISHFGCIVNEPEFIPERTEIPRLSLSLNQRCRETYNSSHVTSPASNTPEQCHFLFCVVERKLQNWRSNRRSKYHGYLDGTPCTKNKENRWCIENECVLKANMKPVDGGWGMWGSWSNCSKTCGKSLRKRYRECINPSPKNGGQLCNLSEYFDFEFCDVPDCEPSLYGYREEMCAEKGLFATEGLQDGSNCYLFCNTDVCESNSLTSFDQVIDGEPCSYDTPNSFCVDGSCYTHNCGYNGTQPLVVDRCGVCGGDNSSCYEVKRTVQVKRYEEHPNRIHIYTFRPGARDIKIKENFHFTTILLSLTDTDSNITLMNNDTCSNPEEDGYISLISKRVSWNYARVDHVDYLGSKGPTTANMRVDTLWNGVGLTSFEVSYLAPVGYDTHIDCDIENVGEFRHRGEETERGF